VSAAPVLPDREAILGALSAPSRALLHSLVATAETASTQTDALAAPTPAHGCAVFLADRQSAGQGRRGRPWISPPAANLYLSLSRRFRSPMAALSGLSLVVGVAVAEALRGQGFTQVGVKWPNDLVAGAGKLGGILIQLRGDADAGGTLAVIGLGINLRMPADAAAQIDQAWCDLAQLGGEGLSRDALAAAVLDALLPALQQFEEQGLAPFLPRWRALDALAGRPVRIVDGAREHQGVSAGITDVGALRLLQDGQERTFHAGEVSLRPA
jgi:BirA family biotin operon repressor/biotin-[acetyl-CoA-carboxylase] ligase